MKKTILSLTILAALGTMALASCQADTSKITIDSDNFAYQAVTTLNMTSNLASASIASSLKAAKLKGESTDTDLITTGSTVSNNNTSSSGTGNSSNGNDNNNYNDDDDDEKDDDDEDEDDVPEVQAVKAELESYLGQADLFLSNQDTPFSVTEGVSDKTDYQFMETISITDLASVKTDYVIYYNSVAETEWNFDADDKEDDEKDDDEKDDKDEDDDDDDDPKSFSQGTMLKGIALLNEKTYFFESKRTAHENKQESFQSIAMRMSLTENDYSSSVTAYYKLQTNKNKQSEKFAYEVRKNGEEVSEFEIEKPNSKNGKIEFETDDNEYTIHLSDTFNGKEGTFLIVYYDDDDTDIFAVYERIIAADKTITYTEVTKA